MKSWSVTIQMKVTDQYFPVVLFILLHKVVQLVSIQMKGTEQCFPVHVVLFIMLYIINQNQCARSGWSISYDLLCR